MLNPILVRPNGKDYEIVHGERRWRACQDAGLTEIPATIRELSDEEAFLIAFTENLQRDDLNPIEEATSFKRMIDDFGYTQQKVANVLGKSQQYVADRLSLLKLTEPVQDMITARAVSPSVGRMLARHDDTDEAEELALEVAEGNLTVRELGCLLKGQPPQTEKKYLDALLARYNAITKDDWFVNHFREMATSSCGLPLEMFMACLEIAECDWYTMTPVSLEIAEHMKRELTKEEWGDFGGCLARLFRCVEPLGFSNDDKTRFYLMRKHYEGLPWVRVTNDD